MPASQQQSTALVVFAVPVFLGAALFGYQAGAVAWRRRKEHEKAEGGLWLILQRVCVPGMLCLVCSGRIVVLQYYQNQQKEYTCCSVSTACTIIQ